MDQVTARAFIRCYGEKLLGLSSERVKELTNQKTLEDWERQQEKPKDE